MASCVRSVGRESNVEDRVHFHMKILGSWHPYRGILREHHDPVVPIPESQFILCANHPLRMHSAYLRLFDFETFPIPKMQHCPHRRHWHNLPLSHIRCTAHYLHRLTRPYIDHCHGKLIGIRVSLTAQYLTRDHSAQPALHRLYPLDTFHFQAQPCQYLRQTLIGLLQINVFL